MGGLGSIPGLGRSSGEGKGYPLYYSGLENSMDCIAHAVTKSRTRLNNFHFHRVICFNSTQLKAGVMPYRDISSSGLDQIRLRKPTWRPLVDGDKPR